MGDELMLEEMEQEMKELEAQREAERIANELEAQALLPLIEEERTKPRLDERVATVEETLEELFG